MAHKSDSPKEHAARVHAMLGKAGYSHGGKMTPANAVHKHESHLHKGEPMTKLAKGGGVKGPKSVNVIIKTGNSDAEKQQAAQQGMQLGARMAAGAPKPPMAPQGPMPGGMPPGGAPMGGPPRPPGLVRGGKVHVKAHTRSKGGKC